MKNRFKILGLFMGALSVLGLQMACQPNGTPYNPTFFNPTPSFTPTPPVPTNTPTITNTPTNTFTFTITNTPGGPTNTPTSTPTITNTPTNTNTPTVTNTLGGATPTPTSTAPASPFVLYSNGGLAPSGSIALFSGGGDGNPGINPADTTGGGGCCSHTQDFLTTYSGLVGGGYSGLAIPPPTGPPANLSGFSTCIFYAKANQSVTVGFNAAEPAGDTLNVGKALTTSWAPQTITITDGSRSDVFANSSPPTTSIARTTNYFVEVITTVPGSQPVSVWFDQVSFQ